MSADAAWAVTVASSPRPGEARAVASSVGPVASACTGNALAPVQVTWASWIPGATYTVAQSTSGASSGYLIISVQSTTTYTSGPLVGVGTDYWYEVTGSFGGWTTATASVTPTPRVIGGSQACS